MAAKNPRVNAVLEPDLYSALQEIADRQGISLSRLLRDLVLQALETFEDLGLAELASSRRKTFDRGRALSHDEVWSRGRRR